MPLSRGPTVGAATENQGVLLVVSGPSGSGKSTLVGELVASKEFPIVFSVSATSRAPRAGEVDGVHYHFVGKSGFEQMRAADAFLESAEVHGNWYGTPRAPVVEKLRAGHWVLLEIDMEGHRQVKRAVPDAVSFFVRTPSVEEYEQRLRARGTESEDAIARRVADAVDQLKHAEEYDFQIVNETVPQALRTFRTLLWGIRALRGEMHDQ